jgi:hypothetical protein
MRAREPIHRKWGLNVRGEGPTHGAGKKQYDLEHISNACWSAERFALRGIVRLGFSTEGRERFDAGQTRMYEEPKKNTGSS